MSKTETQIKLNESPAPGVFQGVDVVKVRKSIQECLDYLESALEMLNHAVNPELPNPNYLLCTYVDLENVLKKVKKAMKELEKVIEKMKDKE
jgi:uncharacterized protein YoxC